MRGPRARSASTVSATVVFASGVAGCVPLPATTFETAPRFSDAQVAAIALAPQTRQSVEAELGPPDLRRDADQLWIYTWTDDYGAWEWVPIEGRWSDNRMGAVESHRHLWVITFDVRGELSKQEYLPDAKPRGDGAFCTPAEVCLRHGSWVHDAEYGVRYRFDDALSAVTIPGGAQSQRAPLEPGADQCVLTVWPDRIWTRSPGPVSDEGGLSLRVEGAGPWARWLWLPSGAYARLRLDAGDHALAVRHSSEEDSQERSSGGTVHCTAGEHLYLSIGGAAGAADHAPVVLRVVDASEASGILAAMAEVLPPD